jgi:integrase
MKVKGKHTQKSLSVVFIRSVTNAGRYGDGNGLYLIVDPSGAKRWVLRTVVMGKRRDIGLGGLLLVSLAEAREEAARLRKIARQHGDPLAERRKEKRLVPTFEQAAREVHKIHLPSWKNVKHAQQWINTLEDYVFPIFGGLRVDQVDTPEVLKALSPIWLKKPETARRVRQRIKTVFDWAKAAGFRSGDNPVDGISKVLPKQSDTQAHHAALPYAEIPTFIRTLFKTDASKTAQLAFEFLILTATRTNEVINATWDEIDLKEKTWTIPGNRMKTKREHRIPLSRHCIEILKEVRKLSMDNLSIFPNLLTGKPLSNMVFLMLLRRMKQDVTAHGFRSSFRDWASERTNIPHDVCEAALAHSLKDKTEAAYKRTDLFDKHRELMESWAAFATKTKADVIPLIARWQELT